MIRPDGLPGQREVRLLAADHPAHQRYLREQDRHKRGLQVQSAQDLRSNWHFRMQPPMQVQVNLPQQGRTTSTQVRVTFNIT